MNTRNTRSAKIAISRAGSLDHNGWLARAALLLLAGALIYGLLAIPANADPAQAPARIANIYDGHDHQPTRSEIDGRERASGRVPSARKQSSDDAVVQQLYKQLTERDRAG